MRLFIIIVVSTGIRVSYGSSCLNSKSAEHSLHERLIPSTDGTIMCKMHVHLTLKSFFSVWCESPKFSRINKTCRVFPLQILSDMRQSLSSQETTNLGGRLVKKNNKTDKKNNPPYFLSKTMDAKKGMYGQRQTHDLSFWYKLDVKLKEAKKKKNKPSK